MMRFFLKQKFIVAFVALSLVLVASFVVPELVVHAATITVDTTEPTGNIAVNGICSLAEAIANANATPPAQPHSDCVASSGADTIVFSGAGTLDITTNLVGLDINDVIDGGLDVNFVINNPVSISGLTLINFNGPAIQINAGGSGALLDGNIIYGALGDGIFVTGATDVDIIGNVIGHSTFDPAPLPSTICSTTNSSAGIRIVNSDDAFIDKNIISCNAVGVIVSASENVQISDNIIGTDSGRSASLGNAGDGIQVSNLNEIVIINNIIDNNMDGIQLTNVNVLNAGCGTPTDCLITDNTVGPIAIGTSGNRENGILLDTVIGYTLDNNTIFENGENGIRIQGASDNIIIHDGTIANNDSHGISVAGSTGVEIERSPNRPPHIFGNDGLGIDFGGNDSVDVPPVTSPTDIAYSDGSSIAGAVNLTDVGEVYVYYNTVCDASTFGEGEVYLDFETYGAIGANEFLVSSGNTTGFITLLLNNLPDGPSYEFSECIPIELLIAEFTPSPNPQLTGLDVNFTLGPNATTGTGITYTWDFGDGTIVTTASTAPIAHAYATQGTYTVELCVNAPVGGLQICTTRTVTIFDVFPTVTPIPTDVPDTPVPVTPNPTVTPILSETATTTDVPTSTLLPSQTATIVPTSTLAPTETLLPSQTSTTIPTSTLLATSTGTITVVPETATAEAIALASLPAPTLVYIGRRSVPIRQCNARNGLLLCVEIDPNSPFTEPVSVVNDDGTVITGGAFEPFVIKFAQPNALLPGSILTYTIQVINPTDSAISNIRVVDAMPIAIVITGSTSTSGNLSVNGRNIVLTQTSLGAGERITITITGRIRDDRRFELEELENRACLTSSGNNTTQCATFGFSPTDGINTGETPLVFLIIRWISAFLLLLVTLGWIASAFIDMAQAKNSSNKNG